MSCDEFLTGDAPGGIEIAGEPAIPAPMAEPLQLAREARGILLSAGRIAAAQKYFIGTSSVPWATYRLEGHDCRQLGLEALGKAMQADAKALYALDSQYSRLEGDVDADYKGGAAGVLHSMQSYATEIDGKARGDSLGGKFVSASEGVAYAYGNAYSPGDSGIARAVGLLIGNNSLFSLAIRAFSSSQRAEEEISLELVSQKSHFDSEFLSAGDNVRSAIEDKLDAAPLRAVSPLEIPAESGVLSTGFYYQNSPPARKIQSASALLRTAKSLYQLALEGESGKGGKTRAIVKIRSARAKVAEADSVANDARGEVESAILRLEKALAEQSAALRKELPSAGARPISQAIASRLSSGAEEKLSSSQSEPPGLRLEELNSALQDVTAARKIISEGDDAANAEGLIKSTIGELESLIPKAKSDGVDTVGFEARLSTVKNALSQGAPNAQSASAILSELGMLESEIGEGVGAQFAAARSRYEKAAAFYEVLPGGLQQLLEDISFLHLSGRPAGSYAGRIGDAKNKLDRIEAAIELSAPQLIAKAIERNAVFSISENAPLEIDAPWERTLKLESKNTLGASAGPIAVSLPQLKLPNAALLSSSPNVEEADFLTGSVLISRINPGDLVALEVRAGGIAAKTASVRESAILANERKMERRIEVRVDSQVEGAAVIYRKAESGAEVSPQSPNILSHSKETSPGGSRERMVVALSRGENGIAFNEEIPRPFSLSTRTYSPSAGAVVFEITASNALGIAIENPAIEWASGRLGCTPLTAALEEGSAKVSAFEDSILLTASPQSLPPLGQIRFLVRASCDDLAKLASEKLEDAKASNSATPQALAQAQMQIAQGKPLDAFNTLLRDEESRRKAAQAADAERAGKMREADRLDDERSRALSLFATAAEREAASPLAASILPFAKRALAELEAGNGSEPSARRELDGAAKAIDDFASQALSECVKKSSQPCGPYQSAYSSIRASSIARDYSKALLDAIALEALSPYGPADTGTGGFNSAKERFLQLKLDASGILADFTSAFEPPPSADSPKSRLAVPKPPSYGDAEKAASKISSAIRKIESEISKTEADSKPVWQDSAKRINLLNSDLASYIAIVKTAVDAQRAVAEKEISLAQGKDRQFGNDASAGMVSQAAEAFGGGKFLTAFAIASQVNRSLPAPQAQTGGDSSPYYAAAGFGIVILIALAYFTTKRKEGFLTEME